MSGNFVLNLDKLLSELTIFSFLRVVCLKPKMVYAKYICTLDCYIIPFSFVLFFFPKQSASFHFQCTRQIISEKLGRGSRTVDLELEAQIDILRDNKKKYENILRLAQTLSTQLFQMVHTQRQLGDAFADLSLKSLELHVRLF